MNDIERLIYLEIALKYQSVALGEDGWDYFDSSKGIYGKELTLLSSKVFNTLEKERRTLIRKLV